MDNTDIPVNTPVNNFNTNNSNTLNTSESLTPEEESRNHSLSLTDWSNEALIKDLCYSCIIIGRNPLSNRDRLNRALREIENRLQIRTPIKID